MKFHRFLKFCLNNCSLIIYNLIIVLFSNCHLSGYPITSIIYYTLFICIFDSKCQFNLIMVANGQVDAASPANIRPTHFLLPVRYADSPRVVTKPLQEMLSSALLWNVGAGRRIPGRWRAWRALAESASFGKAFAVADEFLAPKPGN